MPLIGGVKNRAMLYTLYVNIIVGVIGITVLVSVLNELKTTEDLYEKSITLECEDILTDVYDNLEKVNERDHRDIK